MDTWCTYTGVVEIQDQAVDLKVENESLKGEYTVSDQFCMRTSNTSSRNRNITMDL